MMNSPLLTRQSFSGVSNNRPSMARKNSANLKIDTTDSNINWNYEPKRIWVKKLGGQPTTLLASSNDLIDDLKLAIINKYPNSIGRFDDAADLSLKIDLSTLKSPISPIKGQETVYLEPDQSVWFILDHYYPQGMSMHEAMIIETNLTSSAKSEIKSPQPISINDRFKQKLQPHPKYNKDRSISPTNLVSSKNSPIHRRSISNPIVSPSTQMANNPSAVLLLPKNFSLNNNVATPKKMSITETEKETLNNEINKVQQEKPEEIKQPPKKEADTKDKVLPSISVLVVEDNAINQAILGAFLRKRKIHYQIAKNGQEAIDKWKKGGFHLVLMDIQLPVKSGIEATKEIRHLEKLNKIGVFDESELKQDQDLQNEDKLDSKVFNSPVIIVALTASSNNSLDRKNALTAGCNDYLTKPVNLVWLQNKITEWGCMQALINFDNWKKNDSRLNKTK
ncbi:unnamed protein product [Candida verbasci]|uniref:Response regulatory domain-containing protein n=1 Tax=Candida verbasci TaxID=1227364 RepID=A0A9W4TTR8_9ASCO|nr:unnamed protein product [Candida verbasci]